MVKQGRSMKTATHQDYQTRLLRVLAHIRAHLDEQLPLETLAEVACLSPFHFHRIFTGMLGEPVSALVRRLRLERAAWQLNTSATPIIEIALDAGYDSHEAFSRTFRQFFACSPSGFRSRQAPRPVIKSVSGIHFNPQSQPESIPLMSHPTEYELTTNIQTLSPLRVACIRKQGPYEECGPAWDKLLGLLGPEGHLGPGTQMIGIGYDDPDNTPPDQIRYDAAVTIDDDFQAFDEIQIHEIPGGRYAVTTHEGPYDQLRSVYRAIFGTWLPQSGHEVADAPCFEIYLNDPSSTDPKDLLTDIYLPLA
ncbi:MAG: AraC family transcriptional regulator [Synoicihabitans sp.]